MSGDATTSDEEGSQEDSAQYDIDDLEMIKTIGKYMRIMFFFVPLISILISCNVTRESCDCVTHRDLLHRPWWIKKGDNK